MSNYSHNSWRPPRAARTLSVLLLLALVLPWPSTVFADASSTPTAATSTPSTVTTGNATASATITNTTNTNVTSNTGSSTPTNTSTSTAPTSTHPSLQNLTPVTGSSTASTTASTTVPTALLPNASSTASTTIMVASSSDPIGTSTNPLAVTTDNQATVSNTATTTANTGSNAASSSGASAITTGNAVATTNVLNVVNTTVTDASGLIAFLNAVLGIQDFNLQNDFAIVFSTSTAQSTNPCTGSCIDTTTLTSATNNGATINNNVTVGATTGGNAASGNSATVTTGNAVAAANIVNVANTNITNSKYLLVVFNNLSDYSGDLVLPNSSFFSQFLASTGGSSASMVTNTNNASIANTASTTANTGGNAASSTAGTITTGNATAGSSIVNTANQNFLGTNSFSMLIHVYGTWSGNIVGLPPGMSWEQTPEGIRIFSLGGNPTSSSNASVTNTNSAAINNNVHVYALTGGNEVSGDSTNVATGNATAGASIYNLANTNIVGSNWASLVFNIFGNWNGNLSFGQPNLWLGTKALSPNNPMMPGSPITYTYTVFNHGDLPATDIVLDTSYQKGVLAFSTGTSSVSGTTGHTRWSIGTLAPGATREFSYTAHVTHALPNGQVSLLPLVSTVTEQEHDADPSDNTDTVVMNVGQLAGTGGNSTEPTFPAHVTVTNSADKTKANTSDTVHYTLTAKNNGGELFNAALVDIMRDPSGQIVQNQLWPLDTLGIDDAVKVTFDLQLDPKMATGTYTNTAQVVGFDKSHLAAYQEAYSSPIATSTLTVLSGHTGQVLGASTTALTCPPYLDTYLKQGGPNSPTEVTLLQDFLNGTLGTHLATNGIFDLATEAAVEQFQSAYAADILAPWHLTAPTGYVYFTTQKKINELQCGNTRAFPLTSAQQIIITRSHQSSPAPVTTPAATTTNTATTTEIPAVEVVRPVKPILTRSTAVGSTTPTIPPIGTTSSITDAVQHLFSRVQYWLPRWF